MSETPNACHVPTRRWNFRSCQSVQCRGIVNDLLPNERCYRCNKLPFAPSDEPDVIGAEPNVVPFDLYAATVHARQQIDSDLHDLRSKFGLWTAEDVAAHMEFVRCAPECNATLIRQLETARKGLRQVSAMQHDNLFHSIGMHCPVCKAEILLAVIADAPPPATCDPTDPHICHRCHQLNSYCECSPIGRRAAPADKRPITDQLMDAIRLLCDRGMYDGADWINHRFVEQAERIEKELGEPTTPDHICRSGPNLLECPECARQRRQPSAPDPAEPFNAVAIECAIGGRYQMPDGRDFWIDGPVAREMTRRVLAAMQRETQGGAE